MSHSPNRTRAGGFTLVELLLAATIGSMIMTSLVVGLAMFGENVEQVRAQTDRSPDEAMAFMTDMARNGWLVDADQGRLDVIDVEGNPTSFFLEEGVLSVTRPSGATGELLDGVSAFNVETDTMHRLRETTPTDDFRTWWEKTAPVSDSLILEAGLPLALGFTMSSAVPEDYDSLEQIDEHALQATLDTMVVSMSYIGVLPDDPNFPIAGDHPGSGPGGGPGGNGNKVVICHVPPGNPANAHNLSVAQAAVDGHMQHGDPVGPCELNPEVVSSGVTLNISLHEARAPDDARPFGPALGSMSLNGTALPSGSASWVLTTPGAHGGNCTHGPQECANMTPEGKVLICHVPPGAEEKAHTIAVWPSAVPAHLAHGDYFGSCGAHEPQDEVYTLELNNDPQEVALDLSPLGALIQPGRAYTLVFEMEGSGWIYLGGAETSSSVNSGVAQAPIANGELMPTSVVVPFRLDGIQTITHTEEHFPVSQVSLTLDMDSGKTVTGSANVLSQVAVPGEWMGAVPGQTEVLEQ